MEPFGMGSLQFLSRVAVHRSCHSCWDTSSSRAMDTRHAARVASTDTMSKVSNSMMMVMVWGVDGENSRALSPG